MGQLKIIPHGVQLTGQTLIMDLLRASSIRSKHGQPITIGKLNVPEQEFWKPYLPEKGKFVSDFQTIWDTYHTRQDNWGPIKEKMWKKDP